MTDDLPKLTRRKALLGIGGIGVGGALGGAGTMAYFSDEESSSGNTITAGELDLELDWEMTYNGADVVEDTQELTDNPGPIFELGDVKPGDSGEATISIHNYDNPAWVHMGGAITENAENGMSEPEAEAEGGTSEPEEEADSDADDQNGSDDVQADQTLSATNLDNSGATPEDLAESLLAADTGVEIVDGSVSFTGDNRGAGTFSGGSEAVGIGDGIILSSGNVEDVEGPNDSEDTQTDLGEPGDDDLDELAGGETFDATVLEFDFTVPDGAQTVYFQYVFGSEEYNEFVGSEFNDVFGFFVNGENVAVVDGPDGGTLPAAINNINNGSSGNDVQPTNPELYVNNDPFNPDITGETVPEDELRDTEMDGMTVVLDVEADVNPGETNTMKLAIADTEDHIFDSWVLIESGSLSIEPPEEGDGELDEEILVDVWYDGAGEDGGNNTLDDGEEVIASGTLGEVMETLNDGVLLDDQTGTGDTEAFPNSTTQYIGFQWELPESVGNRVQSDSVVFDLDFYAEQARHNSNPENPFAQNDD